MGLERTRVLLDALGAPDRGLHGVLVGGTNGKGSTCAHLVSILRAAGMRTGSMPKPHLRSYTERICIDGFPITEQEFAALVTEIQPVVAAVTEAHGAPTEFEMLTAAAILHLRRAGCEALVCEVGMGGRLDSTNVLDLGVKVITGVDLDHQQWLGPDERSIAGEKAGIVHAADLVVTGPLRADAEAVVATRVAAVGAQRWASGGEVTWTSTWNGWDGSSLDLHLPAGPEGLGYFPGLSTPLVGEHQAANAAVAAAAAVATAVRHEFPVDEAAVRVGLAQAHWPGRLELVEYPLARLHPPYPGRRMLVDGGHNPAALRAVTAATMRLAGEDQVTVLFAAMQDKDWKTMLSDLPADWPAVFTAVDDPRAERPGALLQAAREIGRTTDTAAEGVGPALRAALDSTPPGGILLVVGSLYLAGQVRTEVGLR